MVQANAMANLDRKLKNAFGVTYAMQQSMDNVTKMLGSSKSYDYVIDTHSFHNILSSPSYKKLYDQDMAWMKQMKSIKYANDMSLIFGKFQNNLEISKVFEQSERLANTFKGLRDFEKISKYFSDEDLLAKLKKSLAIDFDNEDEIAIQEKVESIKEVYATAETTIEHITSENVSMLHSILQNLLTKEKINTFSEKLVHAIIIQFILSILFPGGIDIKVNVNLGDTHHHYHDTYIIGDTSVVKDTVLIQDAEIPKGEIIEISNAR